MLAGKFERGIPSCNAATRMSDQGDALASFIDVFREPTALRSAAQIDNSIPPSLFEPYTRSFGEEFVVARAPIAVRWRIAPHHVCHALDLAVSIEDLLELVEASCISDRTAWMRAYATMPNRLQRWSGNNPARPYRGMGHTACTNQPMNGCRDDTAPENDYAIPKRLRA
jgi:hypothetical protein